MKTFLKLFLYLPFLFGLLLSEKQAPRSKDIKLPPPRFDHGRPLMQCLKERQSIRDFSPEPLSLQVLSELIWAAYGINRPDSGKRTAPSAVNWQNIDVYVALAEGLYLYEPKEHKLLQIGTEDIRGLTGLQEFVKSAPLNLVYVADLAKIPRGSEEEKKFYSAAHTGFISQNVYLYCASEGLATVVRARINREELAKAMKLRPDQMITLAQTVGYLKK